MTEDTFFEKRARRLVWSGGVTLLVFLTLILIATFVIRIGGAVIASGQLIAIGNTKTVQHPQGGVVKELLVENSQRVDVGDPLIVLDETFVRTEFNVVMFRRIELRATLARLNAELAGNPTFSFPYLRTDNQNSVIEQAIRTQENLFTANIRTYRSETARLRQRIEFLTQEIEALNIQLRTTEEQLAVIRSQLAEIAPLVAEQLIPKSREFQLKRDELATRSQIDAIGVSQVQIDKNLTDARAEYNVFLSDHERGLLAEIAQTETDLKEVEERYVGLDDQLDKLVITAPVGGVIHDLQFRNAQAVIGPGELVMQIVPNSVGFEIKARVSPQDIDQLFIDQAVRLRFEAFDANETPEVFGAVNEISADSLINEQTGQAFYNVSVTMTPDEVARLGGVGLLSGLPVTAMFQTRERSLMSYFLKPVQQQAMRAFR